MKKSIIGPDFEKKDAVPPYSESKQALKLKRRVSFTNECWLVEYHCLLKITENKHVLVINTVLKQFLFRLCALKASTMFLK